MHPELGTYRNPLDPSKQVHALLFDVDGTLYRQRPVRLFMALELVSLPLSRPTTALARLRALRAYRHAQEQLRTTRAGSGLASRQIDLGAAASGLTTEVVTELVEEWMAMRPLKYLRRWRAPGTDALLRQAAERRVAMAVLSDYPAHAKLRALGIEGWFEHVLCTTEPEIDAFKPHPRGFLRACRLLNVEPQHVLMVGDRADADAAGAAAAGMSCVLVGAPESRARGCLMVPSLQRLAEILNAS